MAEKRTENPRDDNEDNFEDYWTLLPQVVVNRVLLKLPYEIIAQLALEKNCKPMYGRLLQRGIKWASAAERKWLEWKWPNLPGGENAFKRRVLLVWQDLLFAFRKVQAWRIESGKSLAAFGYNSLTMGRALDQVARCHHHMRNMVAAIQARIKDLDRKCRADFYLKSALQ